MDETIEFTPVVYSSIHVINGRSSVVMVRHYSGSDVFHWVAIVDDGHWLKHSECGVSVDRDEAFDAATECVERLLAL